MQCAISSSSSPTRKMLRYFVFSAPPLRILGLSPYTFTSSIAIASVAAMGGMLLPFNCIGSLGERWIA